MREKNECHGKTLNAMGEGMHKVLNWKCMQNLVQHMQDDMKDRLHPMLNCRSMQKLT